MALSIGSIVSRYSQVADDKLDPADQAYLDECRRHSGNNFQNFLSPNSYSSSSSRSGSKPSLNPYHESFRAAQSQVLLQQQLITKHRQQHPMQWSWKNTALLTLFLSGLIAIIIATACIYAGDIRHGHYVRFFSLLIGILFVSCILIVIATKLYPCLARRFKRKRGGQQETLAQEPSSPAVIVTVDNTTK